ncbi:MAG TPA: hypothetical protein VJP59_09685 [Gemmatimonadota bacterium]|nr:hypothetical protein [Gemmatimonadota bacterium]
MTGPRGPARRLALPALLLTLLVPAQAISLCCLEIAGTRADAARHPTHPATPHHRSEGEAAPVGQALRSPAPSTCDAPTTAAPAIRERDRSSDPPPGGIEYGLASAGMDDAQAADRGVLPRPSRVSHLAAEERPHPLRL